MKFSTFENIVEAIYKNAIPLPKDQCSKKTQLGVSFAGGYIAGVLCAIVSHPADNLVSFLNNAKGATVGDVRRYFHYPNQTTSSYITSVALVLSMVFYSLPAGCE